MLEKVEKKMERRGEEMRVERNWRLISQGEGLVDEEERYICRNVVMDMRSTLIFFGFLHILK